MSELLTLEEAGTLLKVSRKTVWYWIKEKRLPGIQAGKQWRVKREDLENFVKAKLPEAPPPQPPTRRKGPAVSQGQPRRVEGHRPTRPITRSVRRTKLR
jgi:excisionase family DNA binding protein